ncbi:MAG: hypothetical protein HZB37_00740 [Planctomycetes bacterium]|nr:hypothetical protein [Planctomycetota bacterium]
MKIPIPFHYLYLHTRVAGFWPCRNTAFCLAATLFGWVLYLTIPSFAGDNPVLVIRSQDIAAYNEAIDGFREECKKADIPIGAILDLKGNVDAGGKVIKGVKPRYPSPRLILSVGVLATTLAKEHYPFTPIIFCMVVNHERFALSGNNVTGIASEASIEEQLLAYKDFFGDRRNIGVIFDPTGSEEGIIREAEQTANKMGFNLMKAEASCPNAVETALKNIIDKIDTLWIMPNHIIVAQGSLDAIFKITAQRRLPTFSSSIAIVKAGALFAISPEYETIGLQASQIAQTLLSTRSTTSLGVQRPEKLRLTVNSKTAKKLGINVSVFQTHPDVVLYP